MVKIYPCVTHKRWPINVSIVNKFCSFDIITFCIVDDLEIFVDAIKLVLVDDGFDLPTENAQRARLTAEESNALCYCGGYLIRSLRKKISKSAHPLKDALVLCLEGLVEGDHFILYEKFHLLISCL